MTMLHRFGVSLLGLLVVTVAEPVALTNVSPVPSPAPSPAPQAKTQAAAALDVVGQTASAKDPLADVLQQEGDGVGQTTSAKDPLADVLQQEGNGGGQTTSAKDPLAGLFQKDGEAAAASGGATITAKGPLARLFQQGDEAAAVSGEQWTAGFQQSSIAEQTTKVPEDQLAGLFQQDGEAAATSGGATTTAKDPLARLFQQDGEAAAASGGATTTAKDPLAGLFQQEAAEDPLAAVMDVGASTPSAQEERKLERDTTTPIAESITDDHCFEDDASWAPLDMQNQGMTSEDDAVACQHRCLSVPGCMHFSFLNATKSCHLQDAFAFHKPNSLGFVSGPFSCQGIRPGQEDYVKIGDRTYLPKELGCLELGTTYAPELGTLSIFSPEQDTDHGIMGMNSIRNCQRQCNVTQGCKYFTVQFPAGYCKLAGASAKPLANMEGAVSGPRIGCNAASALATGGLGAIMVKDTVGTPSVNRVGGIGTPAVVVLLVLASITAVAFRFQRGIYERLREQQDSPDDSSEGEPNQAPLLV